MSDPKRLLDDLGGGELKGLLSAGKSELPDDAQMLALAAKIGVAGALGGLGGAGAAGAGGAGTGAGAGAGAGAAKVGVGVAAVKGATAIKIGVAVAVVSAAGAGTVAVTSSQKTNAIESKPSGIVAAPSVTATSTTTSVASESLPSRIDPFASASAPSSTEPSAKPSAPAVTKSAAPNPTEEVKLLERAQDALRSGRHAEALTLCNEHAKSFPSGMLAQEREVIAVEALVKTGRTTEAKARAEKFKARFPGSSHTRRIDALLGQ